MDAGRPRSVTPKRSYFMKKSAFLFFSLLACLSGCAGQQATGTVSELDPEAVQVAERQQDELSQTGYVVEGRAWFDTGAFATIYVDKGGARAAISSYRAGHETMIPEQSMLEAGEDFWSYVERIRPQGDYRPLTQATGAEAATKLAGPNVLLFAPGREPTHAQAATAGEEATGSTTQAVVGQNNACPLDWYNLWTPLWFGYNNFATKISDVWDLRDRTSLTTKSNTQVVGTLGASCVDKGTNTVSLTHSSVRAGHVAPANLSFTQQQGWGNAYFTVGDHGFEERCVEKFLGICIDYHWFIKFGHYTATSRVTPGPNSEVHFAGRFSRTSDIDDGDESCRETATCPVNICQPGLCPLPN